MRIIILGGFLGSGKTSVLLQFARYLVDKEKGSSGEVKVAIIENEVGDVGIDDKVLVNEGFSVSNLFAGCACCSLSGELVYNIKTIQKELKPEWLIIEATGIAHPGSMKQTIRKGLGQPSYIVTIVDAKRWKRLARAMETMVTGQLEDSSKVLMNKADLVNIEELEEAKESVQSYNRRVEIIATNAKEKLPIELWKKLTDEVESLDGDN